MRKTKKRTLFFCFFLLLVFCIYPYFFPARGDYFERLPTTLSCEEGELGCSRSCYLISLQGLDKWEKPLKHYFKSHKTHYVDQLRFYTYLYLMQKDAAFLSYNVRRGFFGTLDPLTKCVVMHFFPDFDVLPALETDCYSEELAKQVFSVYKTRMKRESRMVSDWIPWVEKLPKAPPPVGNLDDQVALMQRERKHLTTEQLELVHKWKKEKQWHLIASDYMRKKRVPIGKMLFVKALLMMGLYDAYIATFESKALYKVPRPWVIDPRVNPLIQTSNSPSYPSGHAVRAGAAEVILSFFFSNDTHYWKKLKKNAAQSRVWGGVHTPEDVIQGVKLGKEVGEQILNCYTYLIAEPV